MKIKHLILAVTAALMAGTAGAESLPGARNQSLGSEATPVSKVNARTVQGKTVVVSREVVPVGSKNDGKAEKQDKDKHANKKDSKNKKGRNQKPSVNISQLARNLSGKWTLVSIGKNGITDDVDIPYIIFEPDRDAAGHLLPRGKVYASNGHKIINAGYAITDNAVTFTSPVASQDLTKTVKYERDMNKVIDPKKTEQKVKMTVTPKLNEFDLSFNDNSNRPMLTFVRHDIKFMDGKWQVNELYGEAVSDKEANVCIDVEQQRIHGNTGCNYFNGDITVVPYEPSSIGFSGMVVDSYGGRKARQERLMLVALEEANSYLKLSDTSIALIDTRGRQVMKLNLVARSPRSRR